MLITIVKIMFGFIVMLQHVIVKGAIVYEAPITAGCGKGQMFAALPLHAERLFLYFGLVTPKLQWSNLIIAPRPTLASSCHNNLRKCVR